MTKIGSVIDGLSNTILIAEDAGRDARFQSPFTEGYGYVDSSGAMQPPYYVTLGITVSGGTTPRRRYWRWAEADTAFGVSGRTNNGYTPDHELSEYAPTGQTAGNNASANDEIFSDHNRGANVVMGDGTVRFLGENINIVVLRALVTRDGKEVINDEDWVTN
jgi:prepilin-type processing-associated H-X9-DG protein